MSRQIEILLNLGAGLPPYTADQIVDEQDDELATRLIRMGVAREVKSELSAELPAQAVRLSVLEPDSIPEFQTSDPTFEAAKDRIAKGPVKPPKSTPNKEQ